MDEAERWTVPRALRRKMVVAARDLRSAPTRGEALLWSAIRMKQLDGIRFRRQQPIGPFVIDFYAPSHRLIVEVDGPVHETQVESDKQRQELLESLGLRFVRLRTEDIERDLASALKKIREELR